MEELHRNGLLQLSYTIRDHEEHAGEPRLVIVSFVLPARI